ncbi:MAG: hypothetical protein AAF152_01610 [Cyanobacteria bacterium P01_A01_bin.114]
MKSKFLPLIAGIFSLSLATLASSSAVNAKTSVIDAINQETFTVKTLASNTLLAEGSQEPVYWVVEDIDDLFDEEIEDLEAEGFIVIDLEDLDDLTDEEIEYLEKNDLIIYDLD